MSQQAGRDKERRRRTPAGSSGSPTGTMDSGGPADARLAAARPAAALSLSRVNRTLGAAAPRRRQQRRVVCAGADARDAHPRRRQLEPVDVDFATSSQPAAPRSSAVRRPLPLDSAPSQRSQPTEEQARERSVSTPTRCNRPRLPTLTGPSPTRRAIIGSERLAISRRSFSSAWLACSARISRRCLQQSAGHTGSHSLSSGNTTANNNASKHQIKAGS